MLASSLRPGVGGLTDSREYDPCSTEKIETKGSDEGGRRVEERREVKREA